MQGLLISALSYTHVIKPTLEYDTSDVGVGLQDFAICIEMALAAVAHHWVYSYRDFWRNDGSVAPLAPKVPPSVRPGDVSTLHALRLVLPADAVKEVVGIARDFRVATMQAVARTLTPTSPASSPTDEVTEVHDALVAAPAPPAKVAAAAPVSVVAEPSAALRTAVSQSALVTIDDA